MNTPVLRQSWAMSAVLANMFAQGIVISYPSSLMPALQDSNSPITTDLNTASWLSSSSGLACFIGFLMASVLMDVSGRKISHIICTLPGMIGWILIYFATGVPQILLGRILSGITTGAAISLGAIIIGEYTSPRYRGVFLNLKTAGVCSGGMFTHIMSHYLSWRGVAFIAVVPYIITLSINLTWPESPSWLVSKQQYERSIEAFYWLRGKSETSRKEIEEIIEAQMERFSKPVPTSRIKYDKIITFFKKFARADFLKPINIIIVSTVLLETCGRHVFPAYAMQIIGEVTNQKTHSFYYTLGLDITITVSAVSSSVLVKMMNRRTLLFSTGFTAVAVLAIVCTYLYLASLDVISKDRSWIPISLLVLYFTLANLGCTPIALSLLGEVLPLAHRGVGSAISGVWISICLMSILQLTPFMLLNMKVHGTFAIFGTITTITLVILYITLPETKDRTLQEIEYYFNNGKYKQIIVRDEVKLEMMDVKS